MKLQSVWRLRLNSFGLSSRRVRGLRKTRFRSETSPVLRPDKLLSLHAFFYRNLDGASPPTCRCDYAGLAFPAVSLARISVLMSDGFSAAYHELLPQFENTTGITVTNRDGGVAG